VNSATKKALEGEMRSATRFMKALKNRTSFTASEAAELLKISSAQVCHLAQTGKLRGRKVKKGGREQWEFSSIGLLDYKEPLTMMLIGGL
jgi:hypothetical protein